MLILTADGIQAGNGGTLVAAVGNAGRTFPELAASPASLRLETGSGIPLFSIQPPPAQKPTFVTPRCLARSKWVKWQIGVWRVGIQKHGYSMLRGQDTPTLPEKSAQSIARKIFLASGCWKTNSRSK